MKLPKIFFRKLIIGAVLLAIATGMTEIGRAHV